MRYLLDTNILLNYIRKSSLSKQLEKDYQLFSNSDNSVVISVVTEGEIKSLAGRNNWGERKLQLLEDYLDEFLVASINVDAIVEKYAEIDIFSQTKPNNSTAKFTARNMGKNDIWIAATAAVLNIPLITTDKDFDHLENTHLNLIRITQ